MKASGRGLSLFLPDLFESESGSPSAEWLAQLSVTARRQWCRSDQIQEPVGMEASLLAAFHVQPKARVSLAQIMAMAASESCSMDGTWMLVSPVHLLPDRDHLLLFDARSLDVTEAESQHLINALNDTYQPDGWWFRPLNRLHWLGYSPRQFDVHCHELSDVSGGSILAKMPEGKDANALILMMNEIQMLFNTHPVNQQREQRGQSIISGAWMHGNGADLESVQSPFDVIYSDDPLVHGLAKVSNFENMALPDEIESILNQHHWRAAMVYADNHNKAQICERFLLPAMNAVRHKRLGVLRVHTGRGLIYRFTPKQAFRFWRHG